MTLIMVESVNGCNLEEGQSRLVDRSWKMKLWNGWCIRDENGGGLCNTKPGFVDRRWGFREGKIIEAEKSVKSDRERIIQTLKKRVTFAATWVDVEM